MHLERGRFWAFHDTKLKLIAPALGIPGEKEDVETVEFEDGVQEVLERNAAENQPMQ